MPQMSGSTKKASDAQLTSPEGRHATERGASSLRDLLLGMRIRRKARARRWNRVRVRGSVRDIFRFVALARIAPPTTEKMIEDLAVFRDILPEAAVKIAFALLCGLLLGAEREIKNKPAGLRTIILITLGAAFFMIVGDLIARVTEGPPEITRIDTSRVAAHVVSGIGFLGGGAIIQSRASIHGLTTAATIWVAAGIGLCIGLGFPLLATGATLIVLMVLIVLDPVRAWMSRRGRRRELNLLLPNDALVLERVTSLLLDNDIRERDFQVHQLNSSLRLAVTYRSRGGDKQNLLNELAGIEGVRGAEIEDSSSGKR